jgi:hypothetical protein
MNEHPTHDREEERDPSGAEQKRSDESGGDGGPDTPAPFAPDSDDESPLGDTDEHSDA